MRALAVAHNRSHSGQHDSEAGRAAASETFASRIAQQHLQTIATVISLEENRQPLTLGRWFFIAGPEWLDARGLRNEGANYRVWRFLHATPANPTRLEPRRRSEAGSGTP
jgi:hypothetical protein